MKYLDNKPMVFSTPSKRFGEDETPAPSKPYESIYTTPPASLPGGPPPPCEHARRRVEFDDFTATTTVMCLDCAKRRDVSKSEIYLNGGAGGTANLRRYLQICSLDREGL